MVKRVLFVAYLFPPVGGAGVQRAVKFVKYLPHHGWQSSVLTVANPSVPVLDESLQTDIPCETIIRRARTLEPGYAVKRAVSASHVPKLELPLVPKLELGDEREAVVRSLAGAWERAREAAIYRTLLQWGKTGLRRCANLLLQPDPQILWMPAAVREGKRLLAERRHSAIVATGPPFSSFLVAASLSRASGLPLILDYRDEWDISNSVWENKRPGRLSLAVQRAMQERVIQQAAALITTTNSSASALETLCEKAKSRARVTTIYNGYDPEEFPAESTPQLPNPKSKIRNLKSELGIVWPTWAHCGT